MTDTQKPVEKPVAWRRRHVIASVVTCSYTDSPKAVAAWAERGVTLEPLYLAAPPAQPVPAQRLSDVQIADCAATIRPYPKELAEVPAEQVIAFVRAIEDALIAAPKDAA